MIKKQFLLVTVLSSLSLFGASEEQAQLILTTHLAIAAGNFNAFEQNVTSEIVNIPIMSNALPPTLLIAAIMHQHDENGAMIKKLLELGADPNYTEVLCVDVPVNTQNGPAVMRRINRAPLPLQFAIALCRVKAVELLLAHKADPTKSNLEMAMLPYAESLLEKIRARETSNNSSTEEKIVTIINLLNEHEQKL